MSAPPVPRPVGSPSSLVPPPSSPLQVSPTLLWLSVHTGGESPLAQPSTHLRAVMEQHRHDCAQVIETIVNKLADKLCPVGDHMRTQALRLYYSILENMIHAETARLIRIQQQQTQTQQTSSSPPTVAPVSSTPASSSPAAATSSTSPASAIPPFRFDAWLFSRSFHSSLVAVSFELVFFAHHCPTSKLFPHVLDTLELSAWDFVKHLELVVRALPTTLPQHTNHNEPTPTSTNTFQQQPTTMMGGVPIVGQAAEAHLSVPSVTKRYLKRLENECLLHLVWKKNSPLLKILKDAENASAATTTSSVDDATKPRASDDEKKAATSPTGVDSNPPTATSPTAPLSVGMGYLSATYSKQFELFSRHLFTLAAEHLSWLCSPSALSISNLHMEACFELLVEILTCRTHLLYERHLDTIILCVLYNITCRVCVPSTNTPNQLDFKRIIAVYLSRWDQNQNRVIKEISSYAATPNVTSDEKMNIIAFYNRHFIHEIKVYSLEHIKPKLTAALEAQALIRGSGNAPPPASTTTITVSAVTPSRTTLGLPPTHLRSPLPTATLATPTFAPSNPHLPSPSPRGARLPHRAHPYSVTPYSHLSVPAGAITPGYGPHHGTASIHTFLSPRKLHIPATNIYLSRMAAPPSQAVQNVAARVALGAVGGTASTSSATVAAAAAGVPSAPTFDRLATPTKSAVSVSRVDPRGSEEDALVALTSFPLSPAPNTHTTARTPTTHHTPAAASVASVTLTPMSRSLYAFGESPRKSLDEINSRLNGHATQLAQQHQQSVAAANHSQSSYASPQTRTANPNDSYPGSASSAPGSGRNAGRGSVRQLFTQA